MSAAAILLIQMRRIIKTFYDAGATHPAGAIVPSAYNIRQSFAFRRLVQRGVLVAVTDERFYLDEEAERQFRKQRMIVLTIVIFILLLGLLASVLFH